MRECRNACWNTMRLGMYQVACKTTLEQVEGQAEALAFQLLDQLGDVIRAGYTGIAESFQAMATELGKVSVGHLNQGLLPAWW